MVLHTLHAIKFNPTLPTKTSNLAQRASHIHSKHTQTTKLLFGCPNNQLLWQWTVQWCVDYSRLNMFLAVNSASMYCTVHCPL